MFRGRPLAERTTYTRDPAGRILEAVTVHEAQWTLTDRAEATALAMHEAGICPCGCGQPVDKAWDDNTEGWWQVQADTACHARGALQEWERQNPAEHRQPGLLPRVVLSTPDDDQDEYADD